MPRESQEKSAVITARSYDFLITWLSCGVAFGFICLDHQLGLSTKVVIAVPWLWLIVRNFWSNGQRVISTDGKMLILKNGSSIRQFAGSGLECYKIRKLSSYDLLVFLKNGEKVSMSLSTFGSERAVRRVFEALGIPEDARASKSE
jgi:hypothetical protein